MIRTLTFAVLLLLPAPALAAPTPTADVEAQMAEAFNYDDPAGTERRFIDLARQAETSGDRDAAALYLSQVARAQGIQGRPAEAGVTLDRASALASTRAVQLRLKLERGRIHRRMREPDLAAASFRSVYEEALKGGLPALAADAAHMLALIAPPEAKRQWVERGLAIAESTDDPKVRRWIGTIAWNWAEYLAETGDQAGAALYYARSLEARRAEGDAELIAATEHGLAVALRKLGSCPQALAIERRLAAQALREKRSAADYQAEIQLCENAVPAAQ